MCDDREALIAYLYEEADAAERRRIDAHLQTCAECRDELRSLRAVRQDLLAWDVPAHESVWKPFAAPQPAAWWRQVPAWGLAAAATLVFGIGLAGGYVAAAPVKAAAEAVSARLASSPSTPTADQVQALEAQLASVTRRLEAAEQRTSERAMLATAVSAGRAGLTRADVEHLLTESEGRINDRTTRKLVSILQDMEKARARDMASVTQQISSAQAQTNENLLRVMNVRTPDREKE